MCKIQIVKKYVHFYFTKLDKKKLAAEKRFIRISLPSCRKILGIKRKSEPSEVRIRRLHLDIGIEDQDTSKEIMIQHQKGIYLVHRDASDLKYQDHIYDAPISVISSRFIRTIQKMIEKTRRIIKEKKLSLVPMLLNLHLLFCEEKCGINISYKWNFLQHLKINRIQKGISQRLMIIYVQALLGMTGQDIVADKNRNKASCFVFPGEFF